MTGGLGDPEPDLAGPIVDCRAPRGRRAVRPLEPQSGDGRRAGDGAYHGGAPVSLATPLRPVRSGGRRQNQPRPTLRIGAVDITRTVKILDGLERPGLQPSPIPVPLNRITEFDELVTRQGLVPVRVRAVAPRGRESGHHPGGASGTRARAAPSDLRPQCHSGRGRRSAPTNTETTTSSSRAPGPPGQILDTDDRPPSALPCREVDPLDTRPAGRQDVGRGREPRVVLDRPGHAPIHVVEPRPGGRRRSSTRSRSRRRAGDTRESGGSWRRFIESWSSTYR